MDQPAVAATKPVLVSLEADKGYFWCSCGRSGTQPFCDGAHQGTAYTPLAFRLSASGDRLLCTCKKTRNPPYCDGSHNNLDDAYDLASMEEIAATSEFPITPRAWGDTGKAQLECGCFVVTPDPTRLTGKGNLSVSRLIGAADDASGMSLFYLQAGQGPAQAMSFPNTCAALFVLSGQGQIVIGGRTFAIAADQAALVCPNEPFTLLPDHAQGTFRVTATVCPQNDQPQWPGNLDHPFDGQWTQRIFSLDPSLRQPMADRFYQVLVDQSSCPSDMTQFLGEAPKSRAAFHRHLYEETITIVSGQGFLWTPEGRAAVQPGDVIFLPRRQPHSLECTSAEGMKLVGVFYPAGSPAINY